MFEVSTPLPPPRGYCWLSLGPLLPHKSMPSLNNRLAFKASHYQRYQDTESKLHTPRLCACALPPAASSRSPHPSRCSSPATRSHSGHLSFLASCLRLSVNPVTSNFKIYTKSDPFHLLCHHYIGPNHHLLLASYLASWFWPCLPFLNIYIRAILSFKLLLSTNSFQGPVRPM